MSFSHPSHPGFQFQYPGEKPKHDGGTMPDCLGCLVETIVGSFPIKDPHVQQRQQRSILDFRPIDYTEPFGPLDHMGP